MSERVRSKKKKRNPIVAFFVPFGLRQVNFFLIVAAVIVMFVGIFASVGDSANNTVALVGFILFAAACLLAMYRCLTVIFKKDVNKRDPEYKTALVNLIIMGVLLVLSVFGIIAAALFW